MEARINKKRALLVSGAIILLCMCIIVGMTYALFTDTQTVTNHLKAGDMKITLKRVELTKKTLDASGYLAETQVQKATDSPVDFTNPTDENVFDLTTVNGEVTELIVPGSKFVAKMQIENHSDVAFGYWIEIVCTDKTSGADLAEQLKVTVVSEKGTSNTVSIGDGLVVGGAGNYVDKVGIDSASNVSNFTVTVEFKDEGFKFENGVLSSVNNGAKSENLNFDLIVYAVQLTSAS